MKLWPFQERAVSALHRKVAETGRVLLVAPTGSGKTVMASAFVDGHRNGDVLFIAHRQEILDQAYRRFSLDGIDKKIRLASVQSMINRKMSAPSLIIVDEAHHIRAASYSRILGRFPGAKVLGLTATPWRLDGRGLGVVFNASVVAATPKELIGGGYLANYGGFAYDAPEHLSSVKKTHGDFSKRQLAAVYSRSRVIDDAVTRYQEHAAGSRTVLFASSVENSMEFCAAFKRRGISAEHVDGNMSHQARSAIIARVRSGETAVLCNVDIVSEGFDISELECCIMARPTYSAALYLQMFGRVLRPKKDGRPARIHDHAENIARHGLVDVERDYSLEGDPQRRESRFGRFVNAAKRAGPVFIENGIESSVTSITSVESPKKHRAMRKREYLAARRAWCMERGLCTDCAANPILAGNKNFCGPCNQKRSVANSARKKKSYLAGNCRCGRARAPGLKQCAACSKFAKARKVCSECGKTANIARNAKTCSDQCARRRLSRFTRAWHAKNRV